MRIMEDDKTLEKKLSLRFDEKSRIPTVAAVAPFSQMHRYAQPKP
jgi:hypothetical protein